MVHYRFGNDFDDVSTGISQSIRARRGECLTGVFSGNASDDYIKVLSHLDTVNGGHRHQEGYYNSLGVLQNKWFAESNWSEGDNDYYGRCPTRQSARRTSTTIVPSSPSPVLYGRASYTEPIEVEPECVEQITQHFLWQGETLFGLRLLPEGVETILPIYGKPTDSL